MDCSIVDILWLSEAFWGARIGNFDIKPTDVATIFANLGTGETSGIDQRIKLRKKSWKINWNWWDLNPGLDC